MIPGNRSFDPPRGHNPKVEKSQPRTHTPASVSECWEQRWSTSTLACSVVRGSECWMQCWAVDGLTVCEGRQKPLFKNEEDVCADLFYFFFLPVTSPTSHSLGDQALMLFCASLSSIVLTSVSHCFLAQTLHWGRMVLLQPLYTCPAPSFSHWKSHLLKICFVCQAGR